MTAAIDDKPYFESEGIAVYHGDCRSIPLPDACVQTCVTSPPYWGLRDYGVAGQLGNEPTPELYVASMLEVFREVWRVLKDDGTLWLNLGDSYASVGKWGGATGGKHVTELHGTAGIGRSRRDYGDLKPKDLVGIPWRVAFALQTDGWYLRSDIIWAKKNCMPESVTDRPTKSHEYIFLLSKSGRYFYDHEAIKEPAIYDVDGTGTAARKARQLESNKSNPTEQRAGIRAAGLKDARNFDGKNSEKERGHERTHEGFAARWDAMPKAEQCTGMRNKRDVWWIAPAMYPEAHFATFPPALIEPCIKAGSRPGDLVLDPFNGSGTTAAVASKWGRRYVGMELNASYIDLTAKRFDQSILFPPTPVKEPA